MGMKRRTLLVSTAVAAVATPKSIGVGYSQNDALGSEEGWPMFGYDERVTRSNPEGTPPSEKFEGAESLWVSEEVPTSNIVVSDRKVYAGFAGRSFSALEARTGEPVWSHNMSGMVSVTPAVRDGRVYIGDDRGMFKSLEAATGEVVWETELSNGVTAPTVVTENGVYVGTGGGMHSLNADTGRVRWRYDTSVPVEMAPVVSNGRVLFGDGGSLRGLNQTNGSQEIEVVIGGNLISIVSDGSRTYPVSGALRAYSESTGNERWSKVIGGNPVGNPVLWDERMYIVSESGEIQSIDLSEEREQEWMTDIGGTPVGSPVLVGDSVYAVTSPISEDTAIVNEVDPNTGNKRGSFSINAAPKGDITVASGVAYVPTSSGLYAVGEELGEPPTALFELGTPEPSVGEEIVLDASNTSSGDNAIASFEWEFVLNGSTVQESGEMVERTFDSEGEWSVTLRVTDEAGLSDTQTSEISVGPRGVERGNTTDGSGDEERGGIQHEETEGNLSSDSGGEGTEESSPLISTRVVDITREMAVVAGAVGVAAAGALGLFAYRRQGTEEAEEPSVEGKAEASTSSALSQSQEPTKTCSECGAEIGGSVSYCTTCGAEVGTEETSGEEDEDETSEEEGQEQQVAHEGESNASEDTSEEIGDTEGETPEVEETETREQAETTSDVPGGTAEEEKHDKTAPVPDEESEDHPETTENVQSQCPECGKSIDASSKFCVHCGTSLGNTTCPECGSEVGEGDKFCISCGVEL